MGSLEVMVVNQVNLIFFLLFGFHNCQRSSSQPHGLSMPPGGSHQLLGFHPVLGLESYLVTSSGRKMKRSYSKESEASIIQWPVNRMVEISGDLVIGGLHMIHERDDRWVCGAIMPQVSTMIMVGSVGLSCNRLVL